MESKIIKSHTESLMEKLNNFMENDILCDITLVAGDDKIKVRAHKSVLAASSEFFDKLINGSFKESDKLKKGEDIVLENINGESLKTIIQFCYTGCANITADKFIQTVQLADQYRISTLLLELFVVLKKIINNENCVEFFKVAEMLHLTVFSQYVMHYINCNFKNIEDKRFCILSVDEIKKVLSSDYLNISSEENVFNVVTKWCYDDFEIRKQNLTELLLLVRMSQLQPEFIRKRIQPLLEITTDPSLINAILNSLYWHFSPKDRDSLQITYPNARKPREKYILIVSKVKNCSDVNLHCYDTYLENLKWVSFVTKIDTVIGLHKNQLICVINKTLKSYSINTGTSIELVRNVGNGILIDDFIYYTALYDLFGGSYNQGEFKRFNIMTKESFNLSRPLNNNLISILGTDKKLYRLYGNDGNCTSIETYNITSNEWSTTQFVKSLYVIGKPIAVNRLGKCYIYILGRDRNGIISLNKYIEEANSWDKKISLPEGLIDIKLVNCNDSINLIGSLNGTYAIFQWLPQSRNWIKMSDLKLNGLLLEVFPTSICGKTIQHHMY